MPRANRATPEQRAKAYNRARVKEEASMMLYALMAKERVSNVQLSRRLGCSRPNITKFLDDQHNFKLDSLADLVLSLGHALHFYVSRDPEAMRQVQIEPEHPFSITQYQRIGAPPLAQPGPPDGATVSFVGQAQDA